MAPTGRFLAAVVVSLIGAAAGDFGRCVSCGLRDRAAALPVNWGNRPAARTCKSVFRTAARPFEEGDPPRLRARRVQPTSSSARDLRAVIGIELRVIVQRLGNGLLLRQRRCALLAVRADCFDVRPRGRGD